MVKRSILLALALGACTDPTTSDTSALQGNPWTRHTIRAIGGTGTATMGADGTDVAMIGGELAIITPWEQGGAVTVDALDGSPMAVVDTLPGGEDARLYDVDEDGYPDAVSASQGQKKIKVRFGPSWSTGIVIGAATNVTKYLQLGRGDFNGDGHQDLLAGGDVVYGNGGVVLLHGRLGWLSTTNARSASAWTWHQVADVGRAMTVEGIDLDADGDTDIFVTNRDGETGFVRGTHALENDGAGNFTDHLVAQISGEPAMGWAGDFDGNGTIDVIDGNRTSLWVRWGDAPWSWSAESVTYPTELGEFHFAQPCDVAGDGSVQFVITTAIAAAGEHGVVILRTDGQTWTYDVVSGADSVQRKYDNAACVDVDNDGDLDVVTAEGGDGCPTNCTDDEGTVWFENPRTAPPGICPPSP